MRRILPVTVPMISGRMNYGVPLSIIGCHPNWMPWLVSHFVNLHFQSRDQFDSFNFAEFPLSIENEYYKPFLERWAEDRSAVKEIVPFLTQHVQAGHYLILFVNKFHIPHNIWYGQTYHPHPVFVYGFDQQSEKFYTKSFDEGFRFIDVEVTFDEMRDAFHTIEEQSLPNRLIRFMRYDESASCALDVSAIRQQLVEFRQGSREASSRVAGSDIYDVLADKVEEMTAQPYHRFTSFLLRKNTHIVWEHALIMERRVQVLEQQKVISERLLDQAQQATQQSLIIRNYLIKYHVRQNEQLLSRVSSQLNKLKGMQLELVTELMSEL